MFQHDDIRRVVDLLERRRVHLYHACQFEDFRSYLAICGLPSRARLEAENLYVTPFTTDQTDRDNAVWDKVFLNLEDFGKPYARGQNAVPTPYGPILLRFEPAVLLEATDVAVCLRSAGARGFRRDQESLNSIDEVDRLFYYPQDHGRAPAALKFKRSLQQEFGPLARSVEVSCTVSSGSLTFQRLVDVVVDPYTIAGVRLVDAVRSEAVAAGLAITVKERGDCIAPGAHDELLGLITVRTPRLEEVARKAVSERIRKWARNVAAGDRLLIFNYERYADYLRKGTIGPIRQRLATGYKFDSFPDTEIAEDFGYEDYVDHGEDDDVDEESTMLMAELDQYGADWHRSQDEGWFYDDDDGDGEEIEGTPWGSDEAEEDD